ncbi:protein FAM228B-like [Diadema antillarum]|uniref:protein FAM228B-like n=1 Tax=Diadema antillarum TaxID=105358 RepID=UPI003A8B47A8
MQTVKARDRLENVRIHSPEVRDKLLDDARENDTQKVFTRRYAWRRKLEELPEQTEPASSPQALVDRRPWSTPVPSRASMASAGSSRSALDQTTNIQNWLCQKAVRHVQEKADPESKETKKMYMDVLNTEKTFVKDVDHYLMNKSFLDLRKKEMLYKKWSERIWEPIDGSIYREMKNYPKVDRRKRNIYKEYLRHGNRKGFVFLDTYDQEEYDPMKLVVPRPAPLKIHRNTQEDPTLHQERERNNEDRTILACQTGEVLQDKAVERHRLPPLPLVPLGRHGTECATWLAMPLHDIESPVRLASRRRMNPAFNDTHFDFSQPLYSPENRLLENSLQPSSPPQAAMVST